jgi:hypothetical protein
MGNISLTDRLRNGDVLYTVNNKGNILHTTMRSKAIWIGRILRKNCLLERII